MDSGQYKPCVKQGQIECESQMETINLRDCLNVNDGIGGFCERNRSGGGGGKGREENGQEKTEWQLFQV